MSRVFKLAREFRLIVGAVLAMAFVSSSAMAVEGYTGWSIGIIANDSDFTTTGKEEEGGTVGDVDHNSAKIDKGVSFPSVFVEYSWGNVLGMTIGLEHIPGEHSIGSGTNTRAITDGDAGDDGDACSCKAEAKVENLTTLYIEPTIILFDQLGIYGKAGVKRGQLNSIETTVTSKYGNEAITGGLLGLGFKYVTSFGPFIKVEGIQVHYNQIELEARPTSNNNFVKAKPYEESARVAIGWNF